MKNPPRSFFHTFTSAKALAAASMLLVASSGFAGINQFSIGLNLGADGGNNPGTGSLNPADVAGLPAVAQANWNNLSGVSGSALNVTDNGGIATSAGVAWFSALGTWSSGINNAFVSTTDHTLMQGYLDNGGTATVTITNIPSQLTTSGYDVYVYALFDTPNRGGTYQIFDALNTATPLTGLLPLNSDSGATNYAQAVGAGSIKTGNYLVFHGLTNANIQLQAVATNLVGTIRATICGVQLVAAPSAGESGAATGLAVAANGQSGELNISWTPGSGSSGSLVVLRQGLPETAQPVDGVVYNANPTFGSGDNLGDDETGAGNIAVYAGSSSSVVVSNLIPTLNYYATVYPYTGSGASINYTLAKAATASGVPAGSATNILLVLPSPIVAGSAKNFQVLAQYQNGATLNVANASTVTSSNNAIVTILGAGRLGAISNGVVGLTAVYSGFTNIQVVTISPMAMTYQWSFNEAAANLTVTDSVAQAVGYVTNSPFSGPDGSGHLVLDGSGGFVALPANLLSNYGGVTIETWATETTAATWERLWDFGSGQTVNMFMSPNTPALRTAFTVGGGGAEQRVDSPFAVDTAPHQYVFTLAGATRTATMFVDGVQVGINTNFTLTPEDMGPMQNVYIGKSQYPDPYFAGTFDEFRIYNGALSHMQIALDAATGPDVITSNPGALNSLTVFGASPIPQFGIEQLSVTGVFANVSSPVNLTTVEGIRYFTSDPNIGIVDGNGIFSATGPGTVQIRATLLGSSITNSVFITVNPIPPGMTHRWPFNADFNDLLGAVPAVPHGTVSLDGLGNAVLDGQGAANGTTGSYLELPGNVLLGYSSIALEAWYTDASGDGTGINRNWARLWDFGSGPGNNLFLTPFVGGEVDTMRLALNTNNAGEWTINCVRPLTNVEHHVVFILDSTNRVATFWVDGQLAGYNRHFLTRPRDLGPNPNDWLGRSQYGDPLFQGLVNEFRIYNGTIDPLQVGIDYVTGPNTVIQNPGALSTVSIALTTNMVAGNPQNAAAIASFASVSGVPVTALTTNWTSSDGSVARVNENGRITAIAPGTALISGTFRGVTASASVIVSASQTPILAHRYSFNSGDATDTGVVGGGTGTLFGTPTFANGMVTIADTASYISLPGHLFDTNLEVTLETWCVVAANSGSGSRMCDFGNSAAGNSYFTLAPTANGNNYISFRTGPNGAFVPAVNTYGRAAFGTTNHYAIVVSDLKRRVDFYFNGQLKDSYPYDNSQPGTLQSGNLQYRYMLSYLTNNMTEGWFGKNVGGAAGSGWFGSIDEFRIWNGPLDKVQVQASYLNGPNNPSIDPGAIQSLSVAMSDTTMVLGSIQRPSVSGVFANVASALDLTALSDVVFTSSDSSKVAVVNGGDTKLQAVGVGSANITASYGGKSVSTAVTVIAKPQAVLTHRYSFRGNVNDSVGHANGALFGNAKIAGGKLVLDGTLHPPTYARLPNDLISGYDQLTIEAFYSAPAGDSGTQQRLWDFGDHILTSGAITGTGYFYEAAGRGAAGLPMNAPGGGEATAIAPATDRVSYTTNTIHVAATIDSPNNILNLYTNGVLAMSVTNNRVNLGLVVDNFSFLGRSQWADPHFNGSVDDFRVYYGVLTPDQVAASFAAGPDPDSVHAVVAGPNQATIFWPATLVTTGYSLQSSTSLTSGLWSNVGGVTQVGGNYQVTVNSAGAPVYFRLIK